jgi:hypothetical protein
MANRDWHQHICWRCTCHRLTHDASILFYAPMLGSFYYVKAKAKGRLSIFEVAIVSLIPLAAIATIHLYGRYEGGQEALNRYLISVHPDLAGGFPMELTWTLRENVVWTLNMSTPLRFFGGSLAISIYHFMALAAAWYTFKANWLLRISTVAPVMVSFIAIDTVRFMGISVTCFACLAIISAHLGTLRFGRPVYTWGACVALVCFSIFGPWGVGPEDPLPMMRYLHLLG